MKQFRILSIAQKHVAPYGDICIVEVTTSLGIHINEFLAKLHKTEDIVTDEFRFALDSPLINDVRKVYMENAIWQVDMSKFKTITDIPDTNGLEGHRVIHEEIVSIDTKDIEAMLKKAIRKSVLAQLGFAGLDELKTYTAKVTTMKDGHVYANHDIDNLVAEDDNDAYKMMLNTISHREGREVHSSDILSSVIIPKGEKLFNFDKE